MFDINSYQEDKMQYLILLFVMIASICFAADDIRVTGYSNSFSSTSFYDNAGKVYPVFVAMGTDGLGNLVPLRGSEGGLTSAGVSMPAWFTVSNSPLTANGVIDITANSQALNTFLSGPDGSGATSAEPSFRSIVKGDLSWFDSAVASNSTVQAKQDSVSTIKLGTLDAYSRSQVWNYGTDSILRLGSLQADGDATGNISSEGFVTYGKNSNGVMDNTNYGFARIKPMRFGLWNAISGVSEYIFKVDSTSLYLANDSFAKTFEVSRSTGSIDTSMGAGVVMSDSSGVLSASTSGGISTTTTGVTIANGANSTIGPNVTVNIATADASNTGLLSSTNWNQFNNKPSGGGGLYGLAYWSSTSNLSALTELKITTTNPKRMTMGGTGTPSTLSNVKINSYDTVNGFLQNNIQNLSTGSSASSDWVATADTGTDTTNYVDLGINGSGFSDAAWTISGALDAYLYSQSTHLTVGTAAAKQIRFHTGGTLASNERMRIDETGHVGIGTGSTALTNALEVSGDVSVSGKVSAVSGVVIGTTGAQPTCSATTRGMQWVIHGGTGVADIFQVCLKDSSDVYGWVTK
jgi:hypothetical protein